MLRIKRGFGAWRSSVFFVFYSLNCIFLFFQSVFVLSLGMLFCCVCLVYQDCSFKFIEKDVDKHVD